MRVRVAISSSPSEELRKKVLDGAEQVEKDEMVEENWEVVMLIDPGQYKVINELLQKEAKGRGRIETMTFAATATS